MATEPKLFYHLLPSLLAYENFLKPNYPARSGITNIREKGVNMHIATFLGEDCPGGNFTNSSGGTYLVDEFIWP